MVESEFGVNRMRTWIHHTYSRYSTASHTLLLTLIAFSDIHTTNYSVGHENFVKLPEILAVKS